MPQLKVKTYRDITGLLWHGRDAAAVLPQLGARPRRSPAPVPAARNGPDQQQHLERAAQSSVKLLTLASDRVDGALIRLERARLVTSSLDRGGGIPGRKAMIYETRLVVN
jgi:hypothetical protein